MEKALRYHEWLENKSMRNLTSHYKTCRFCGAHYKEIHICEASEADKDSQYK